MALPRSINQDDLRSHNLSVMLDAMLRAERPMSRSDLARQTGLTKATMSLLASMLIDNGVVTEGKAQILAGYGRPSTPLMMRGGRVCGLGLQINTDGYGCLALDVNGDTLSRTWVSADMTGSDPDEVFAELDSMAGRMERGLGGCEIVGVGLAVPGVVAEGRRLLMARNLGWRNIDFGRFDVVHRLDAIGGNEAKMAAIAQIPGYATVRADFLDVVDRVDSFLYLSTDIGIGGAVVRDGEVVAGAHGFAGEIGHLSIAMDGPTCRCGRRGCLETFAGRVALIEAAGIAEGRQASSAKALDRLLQGWQSGDAAVVAAVERATEALACAIASAVNLIDVDTVLMGGLWARFGDGPINSLTEDVNSQILVHPVTRVKAFVPPVTVNPALYGAAEVGLRRFIDDPMRFIA